MRPGLPLRGLDQPKDAVRREVLRTAARSEGVSVVGPEWREQEGCNMNMVDISSLVAIVATAIAFTAIALVAIVFGRRVRMVVSETIKHPFKKTEIKLDEGGKVLEIRVSDGIRVTDRATAEKQPPRKD